jgi:hypothetical protein
MDVSKCICVDISVSEKSYVTYFETEGIIDFITPRHKKLLRIGDLVIILYKHTSSG